MILTVKRLSFISILALGLVLCLTTMRIAEELHRPQEEAGPLVDEHGSLPRHNVDIERQQGAVPAVAQPPEATAQANASAASKQVWAFKHVQSSASAVLLVRGLPIEAIHSYLVKPSKGKGSKAIKVADLKIHSLLPEVNATLPADAKRAWIDVGARMFGGSTMWFLKRYPDARAFDAVAFELLDLKHTYTGASKAFHSFEYVQKAAWTHSNGVVIKGFKMARVSDGVVEQKGDNRAEWKAPSEDLAAFIQTRFTERDFVALKVDIEGGEWTLIPHLIRTGAMRLVDELFLECHPIDFDDYARQPGRLPQICIDFINDLRDQGVYCHRWF